MLHQTPLHLHPPLALLLPAAAPHLVPPLLLVPLDATAFPQLVLPLVLLPLIAAAETIPIAATATATIPVPATAIAIAIAIAAQGSQNSALPVGQHMKNPPRLALANPSQA